MTDRGTIHSGEQVHSGYNVRVPIPPAFPVGKPVPAPVVPVKDRARRVGIAVTGVRGVDCCQAGTSHRGPKRQPLPQGLSCPTGHGPGPLSALRHMDYGKPKG